MVSVTMYRKTEGAFGGKAFMPGWLRVVVLKSGVQLVLLAADQASLRGALIHDAQNISISAPVLSIPTPCLNNYPCNGSQGKRVY